MRIVVIVAGTNDPSNAETVADAFVAGINNLRDVEVEKILLRDLPLEHFELSHYAGREPGEGFERVKHLMQSAQGIVFASPVWNFSVPAHLKNFIDHVGSFALDEYTRSKGQLKGLPCFFLFTGGAPAVAWRGLMRFTTLHMPESMRYFGGSIIGVHYEGRCLPERGKFGLVMDKRPDSLRRITAKGTRFALLVKNFVDTGKLPLWQRTKAKIYKWGQRVLSKL